MLAYYWELFDKYDDMALDLVRDVLRARHGRLQELGHHGEAAEVHRLWLGATLVLATRQEFADEVLEPRAGADDQPPGQLSIDDVLPQ